ncbi:MAG: prephenate dehydratase [Elusimicrobiota bacterium]
MVKQTKAKLRRAIDAIDGKIVSLLNHRARHAMEIGKLKSKTGEDIYIPDREKKIISGILTENKGPLPKKYLINIFSEILNSARSLQSKLKISYLGPSATFTHQAAVKKFGRYCNFVPAKTIRDVFIEVEKGRADYGVVPIENSAEGVISHTLDMFIESDLAICSEMNMAIEHCLLSREIEIKKIKKVYSHPQALGQCRNYLEANLADAEIIETSSTASAADIAGRNRKTAAIASSVAAEPYGLKIVVRGIEDAHENYTRFLVVGHQSVERSGYDKTSVMFSIKDRVGALHDMLVPFRRYRINLTKIESRPTRKRAWEYIFFIDFLGHIADRKIRQALEELKKQCVFLKVLGSYPRAE